jgi:hypothetical protein
MKSKSALHKEISKKYDTPGRNPEKAIDGMYGLWEGKDISVEKIRGATNKEGFQQINRFLRQYIILPICHQISNIFSNLVQKYVLSHDTDIADTFVAATALHYQLPLLTMNQKHYKHIPRLQLIRHTLKPLQGGKA